jgi:hypothetical protein
MLLFLSVVPLAGKSEEKYKGVNFALPILKQNLFSADGKFVDKVFTTAFIHHNF